MTTTEIPRSHALRALDELEATIRCAAAPGECVCPTCTALQALRATLLEDR